MGYDEKLAERMRVALRGRTQVAEKKMFGGVAFMLGDKMFCGVVKGDLMVRVGPHNNDTALARPHTRPMDFTGKPMSGYVFVEPAGCKSSAALAQWLEMAAQFVATLPSKQSKATKRGAPTKSATRKVATSRKK